MVYRLAWPMFLFLFTFTPSFSISKEIKAIIWDCDGVLVDTEFLKFLSWQYALEKEQISFALEEYEPLVGFSSQHILKHLEELKKIKLSSDFLNVKNQAYRQLQLQEVPIFHEMVAMVKIIKSKYPEIKLGLAYSASHEEIRVNLKHCKLENLFDLVLSGTDDLNDYEDAEGTNKPKPYIYIEASKRFSVPPENCLVIEDSSAGVRAASGAKMNVIAVPNLYTLFQDFSLADHVIDSALSLINFITCRI